MKTKIKINTRSSKRIKGQKLSLRERCKRDAKKVKIVNEPIQDESHDKYSSETESVVHDDDYDMENMNQNNLTNSVLNSDIEVEETIQLASAIFNESDEDKDDDDDEKLIDENEVTDENIEQNDENTTDNMSDGLLIESDTSKNNHKRQSIKKGNNKLGRKNLDKAAVKLLKDWVYEHRYHAYPSDAQKEMLSKQTGFTLTQISNWFINARRRILPEYLKREGVVLGKDKIAHIIKRRKKTLENKTKPNDEPLKPKEIKNIPIKKNIRVNEIKNVPITKNIRISTEKFVLIKNLGFCNFVKKIETPVKLQSLPSKEPSKKLKGPSLPLKKASLPLKEPSLPSKQQSLPLKQPALPLKEPSLPSKQPSLPLKEPSLPLKESSLPSKQPSLPLKESSVPLKESSLPLKESSIPLKRSSLPLKEPVPPLVKLSVGKKIDEQKTKREIIYSKSEDGSRQVIGHKIIDVGSGRVIKLEIYNKQTSDMKTKLEKKALQNVSTFSPIAKETAIKQNTPKTENISKCNIEEKDPLRIEPEDVKNFFKPTVKLSQSSTVVQSSPPQKKKAITESDNDVKQYLIIRKNTLGDRNIPNTSKPSNFNYKKIISTKSPQTVDKSTDGGNIIKKKLVSTQNKQFEQKQIQSKNISSTNNESIPSNDKFENEIIEQSHVKSFNMNFENNIMPGNNNNNNENNINDKNITNNNNHIVYPITIHENIIRGIYKQERKSKCLYMLVDDNDDVVSEIELSDNNDEMEEEILENDFLY